MTNLRKQYTERRMRDEQMLHEGILDAFNGNASNVQMVKQALQQSKNVAQTYKMKNILTAINTVEQKFQASLAGGKLTNKPGSSSIGTASSISYILTFSDIIGDFFRELDSWIMQLPMVSQAIEQSSDPANAQKTLKELVSQQGAQGTAANPISSLTTILQKQFEKSAGGFLKTIGRWLGGKGLVSSGQALQFAGLTPQGAAEDILNVTASQYGQLRQAGQQVPTVQLNASGSDNPESGSTKSSPTNATQNSVQSTPGQQTVPAQATNQSGGNAQMAAKPDPETARKRDTALQSVVKNRNAFNTQNLGSLSNEEIKSDISQILRALGITL